MAGTIGTAYIQILPSTKGISGSITNALEPEAKSAGNASGETAGSSLVGKLKSVVTVAAPAIGAAMAAAISQGAKMEQSLGGIETLYGESANKMISYANQAFQTVGVSANEYMEQATRFSAGLIASMGGDTAAAADVANMALIDMADNANKMGTSMESIQNAYQGFAKQNYTMLDNLALGYGGTKAEMERLLADAQALSGVEYNIENLDDVYNAIHVIQQDLGITGTTAEEASSTFSGSMASMKAAAADLLGNLALGKDIMPSLTNLVTTTYTFLHNNLLRMIGNIVSQLPGAIAEGLPVAVNAVKEIIDGTIELIYTKLPEFLESGVKTVSSLANGLMNNMPKLISTAGDLLSRLLQAILYAAPQILQAGVTLIQNLAQGLINNLPAIVSSAAQVITKLISQLGQGLPQMLQKGVELIAKLAAGLIQSIPSAVSAALQAVSGIGNALTNVNWASIGSNMMAGVARGIANGASAIVSAAKSAANRALSAAKSFLGIHSPSTVFRDEIGSMIPEGMAIGIEMNTDAVSGAMKALADSAEDAIDTGIFAEAYRRSENEGKSQAGIWKDDEESEVCRMISDLIELITEMKDGMPEVMKKSVETLTVKVDKREIGRVVREANG